MAQKKKEQATVLMQQEIAPGIYDCRIRTGLARESAPGQFITVYPRDKSTLLPRPISICEVNKEEETLRIVYRVAGKALPSFPVTAPETPLISWESWGTASLLIK